MSEPKIVSWIKSRFGLTSNVLRPVPEYSMNPFYWLGALTVIAFLLQVVTGLLLLIYYVPTTDQAYSSTLFIMNSVPLGLLLQTVHLYGAYAMILLAFLHMFRGYFASVHKKPREMMWLIGMGMGFTVLGFGLTGYLLPWTVVSKSATDVSIGMLGFLPAQIGPSINFLIAGTGSEAAELARFFDLHIVVLPAVLLVLLATKLYIFEAHGAAEPAAGLKGPKGSKELPWFPNVFLYFGILGALLIAVVLVASSLFPLSLPPEYTPLAASNNVPQPEWYFLWVYQVLKFASFEKSGIYYALGAITILVAAIILLPFGDRSSRRNPAERPLYVTLGLILVAELVALTVWGYLTPGEVIPDSQALVIILGVGLSTGFMSLFTYRAKRRAGLPAGPSRGPRIMALPFAYKGLTAFFLLPLGVASVSLANLVGTASLQVVNWTVVAAEVAFLTSSLYAMVRIIKVLTDAQRRVPV